MNNVAKILIVLFFFVMITFALRNEYLRHEEEHILVESHHLAYGKIIYFGEFSGRTGGKSAEYIFQLKDKKYRGRFQKRSFCKNPVREEENIVKHTNIPVVYLPSNPEISRILLKESDYEKYKVPYPDSIRNFLNEFFECK